MKKVILRKLLVLLAAITIPAHAAGTLIVVSNNSDVQRHELIELNLDALRKHAGLAESEIFLIKNTLGQELPYQLSHDGQLLMEVSVQPHAKATYQVMKGTPQPMRTYVCGKMYPLRKDDIAWENDRCAYRVYGPALQRTGEKSYGIDVWVKNVPYPVVEKRYEIDHKGNLLADSLKSVGLEMLNDSVDKATSFHLDHGEGMDAYAVGPTLGCGTPALMNGRTMIFPYCYERYRILDNGPLRFTVELDYAPNKDGVVEHRRISLDKGAHFNRMTVWYEHIRQPLTLATGVVLHKTGDLKVGSDYICYADPTDRPDVHNSQIYVGVLFPEGANKTFVTEDKSHAIGMIDNYKGNKYTYYFGAAWSNYDIRNFAQWALETESFLQALSQPLTVTLR